MHLEIDPIKPFELSGSLFEDINLYHRDCRAQNVDAEKRIYIEKGALGSWYLTCRRCNQSVRIYIWELGKINRVAKFGGETALTDGRGNQICKVTKILPFKT